MATERNIEAHRSLGLIFFAVPAALFGLLFAFDEGLHEVGVTLLIVSSILYGACELSYGVQRALLAQGKSDR